MVRQMNRQKDRKKERQKDKKIVFIMSKISFNIWLDR